MSLSRRLVLILLAVSAIGLLALALASYFALRSYLSDRVDQQARDAAPLVVRSLAGQAIGAPSPSDFPVPPGAGSGPAQIPIGPQLPAGTYGEVRSADGRTIAGRIVSGGESSAKPDLPADLPADAGFGGDPPIDVPSEGRRQRLPRDAA